MDNKCGRLISVVQGWQCEKCGKIERDTNKLWEYQSKCKGDKKGDVEN